MDKIEGLLRKAKRGDEKAKEKILKLFQKDILWLAKNSKYPWTKGYKIQDRTLDIEDICQEENIILLKAIENFKFIKKVSFRTYLVKSLKMFLGHLQAKERRKKRIRFSKIISLSASLRNSKNLDDFSEKELIDILEDIRDNLEKKLEEEERNKIIRDLISEMNSFDREIFKRFLKGEKIKKIIKELKNKNRKFSKSKLYYLIKKHRKKFETFA